MKKSEKIKEKLKVAAHKTRVKFHEVKNFIKSTPRHTWLILCAIIAILLLVLHILSPNKMPEKSAQTQIARKEIDVTPKFDIVRVENGKAVIAGRSMADTEIHIMSGDKEIGVEKTDERGEFVFLPEKDFTAGTYELSLWIEKDGKKITSSQNAVLTVPTDNKETVAVLVGGTKKAQLLQAPKGEEIGSLKIAMVEYNFKNTFRAEGQGTAGTKVNLYIDNQFIEAVKVDEDGKWNAEVEQTLTQDKAYKLRADMVNEKGIVISRVENEFSTDRYEGDAKTYVVKKGDCLWRIARREYGRGIDYVLIFKANKSQIKNPDLIYPNQIFAIPEKK